MKSLYIAIVLTAFFNIPANAQDKSNRGKEFWLGYGFNYGYFNDPPVNQQELALYISTELPATVTVSINSTGWTTTVNIPANTVNATILIPKSGPNDARILTDGLSTKGIHILSDVPVAVYAHVYALMVSGATMLMPVETYGYSYYSINYYQTTSQSSPSDWYSWFYAIASEDNTRLEITPSDTTKNGWLPGQTYTVNLNKGEMFNVFGKAVFNGNPDSASKDMSGSKIISVPGADGNCHPFALFSGSGGIRLCRGDGGEFMHQQVFPAQAWGTRYLTHHTLNNTNTNINATFRNYYRICVQDPATVVKRNGVVMTGLIKNFFYEYMDSTGGDYYEADKPIMVAQYTPNKNQCWNFLQNQYGDPEMIYLSPIEQGQKFVRFYTSSKFGIDYVYSNITIPTAGLPSLLVDGVPIPASRIKVHPNNPAYSVAFANLTNADAQHTISSDSAFTALVEGIGYFESYGYNVGTLINNLNYYSEIKNVGNTNGQIDTFTCKNTPVRLFVKIAYPATSITWKLSQVPGIFPNVDSVISNPVPLFSELINGRTYYTYTLQQNFTFANTGTFYLPVSFTAAVIQNCSQTENASVKIVVNPGPVANFTTSVANCLKDTIHFTHTTVSNLFNITSYLWNFDDATTQTTIDAAKLFASSGIQNVRYRIYADNGCTSDTTKVINIFPSPTAILNASSPACATDSVLITDNSTITSGSISSWQYFFGDATSLVRNTNSPFYHAYALPGTYTIKLITTSNNNCISDTAYKTVNINAKPLANFGYSGNICVGDSIYITDTSYIALGSIVSWQYDFGDGNTLVRNTNAPFYHTYNTSGSFVLWLITTSDMGCKSDTFRRTIIVSAKPVSDFSITSLNCLRDTIYFNHIPPAGTFNITGYLWNFDDATTQTTIDARKKFTTAGIQHIRYRVFADNGCAGDTTKIITVFESPVARLGVTTTPCVDSVLITDTSSIAAGSINSWEYHFGDGNSLIRNINSPFYHQYLLPGIYQVWLITNSDMGCKSDTAKQTITITTKPLANFTITPLHCLRDTVFFNHIIPPGSFNITGYLWNFDDGTTQTTIDAKKKFATSGIQHIRYRVFADNGCFGDSTKIININAEPLARLGVTVAPCGVDSVLITDTSSIVSGNISYWQYDFGDGNTLSRTTNTAFYHRYLLPGTYTIWLITTSDMGCKSDTSKRTITIIAKPVTAFTFSGTACVGNTITFTSSYTSAGSSDWYWAFGDGQVITSTTSNITTHIYTTPQNNIVVKHVVHNSSGCASDTSFITIPVMNQIPVASFSIKKDTVCENKPVLFTSLTTGINIWNWNFGNGTGINVPPFNWLYNNSGTYNINLTVTDNNGCISLVNTDVLIVNATPIVYAGADKTKNLGGSVLLDATVSPTSVYNYLWTPATNLSSAVILQPYASPAVTTTYLLKAEDANSHCMASDDVIVKVVPEIYIPNAFTPNGDGLNDVWNIPGLAFFPTAVVTIFNRYGETILQRSDYYSNPWDGTFKGKKQPLGTYVYLVKLNDKRNQIFQGTLTLIR